MAQPGQVVAVTKSRGDHPTQPKGRIGWCVSDLHRSIRTLYAEGRLDLEIEQADPIDRSKVTRHAILELKVLRSFGETGTIIGDEYTRGWVDSGVKQAHAYRESKAAKWSALFCFDMRKDNSGEKCFDHVRDLAQSLNVFLKCWFLYAKSKYYRNALASTA